MCRLSRWPWWKWTGKSSSDQLGQPPVAAMQPAVSDARLVVSIPRSSPPRRSAGHCDPRRRRPWRGVADQPLDHFDDPAVVSSYITSCAFFMRKCLANRSQSWSFREPSGTTCLMHPWWCLFGASPAGLYLRLRAVSRADAHGHVIGVFQSPPRACRGDAGEAHPSGRRRSLRYGPWRPLRVRVGGQHHLFDAARARGPRLGTRSSLGPHRRSGRRPRPARGSGRGAPLFSIDARSAGSSTTHSRDASRRSSRQIGQGDWLATSKQPRTARSRA